MGFYFLFLSTLILISYGREIIISKIIHVDNETSIFLKEILKFYDVTTFLGSRGNPDPDFEERNRRSSTEKEGGTSSLDSK